MYNIVEKRRWFFLISALVIIPGIVAMVYSTINLPTHSPVRLSIDFVGGSLFVLDFEEPATEDAIRDVLTDYGLDDPVIQQLGDVGTSAWQIRTAFVSPEEAQAIQTTLSEEVAPLDLEGSSIDTVAPSVGAEVTRAAVLAVVAVGAIILGFIVVAFRQVPRAFRYGACAVFAMIHDVIITMGIMSILGLVFGWEVDALFLTAMLTVVAFSVQDSIVIFDRIRENIPKRRGESYETVVNRSILETIHRSLATQLNAVFIMVAILLFGGATIKQFIAILLIGLLSGTYSSIFTAVPLLVAWERGELPFTRRAIA
jgi:preprotein translocase SecF subunit